MRRTPIRMKLALTLAVPLAALLVRTVVDVHAQARDMQELRSQAELARAATGPGGLISQLQDERTWAVVELVGASGLGIRAPVESYEDSRLLTDEAISALRLEIDANSDLVGDGYAAAMAGLDGLDTLRAEIDENRATAPAAGTTANNQYAETVYQRYVDLVRPFFDATKQIVGSIRDPRLRQGAEFVNLASQDIQQYSDMSRHMLIDGMSANAVDTREELRGAAAARALWDEYNTRLTGAMPPFDEVVDEHYPFDAIAGFTDLSDRSLGGEAIPLDELIAPMATTDWAGLKGFRIALADEVNATADRIVADAQRREQVFVLTAIASLVVAMGLCWLVSRSITVPLRSLTRQASSMAHERLPAAVVEVLDTPLGEDVRVGSVAPVSVATRDEVGEVADALNVVQDTALRLAVEQAVLRRNIADSFLNLGRRNQNLLARQLDFITGLENEETDPEALANLYRLDHLATRMRRNAESLLVLAGIEPPRRWTTPVSALGVVRAALGEVEDYQRVIVRDVEPATLVGVVAADLAHLLAELIENALTFSDSHRTVDIKGRRQSGGYVLAVIDTGVGMDAAALDVANRRLAGAESFTVAPSKYLGHYVAGNLAARHGIVVRLQSTPGRRGTAATVALPSELLVAGSRVPVDVPVPGAAVPTTPPMAGPVGARMGRGLG